MKGRKGGIRRKWEGEKGEITLFRSKKDVIFQIFDQK